MTPHRHGASAHRLNEEKLRGERRLREAADESNLQRAILKFHEIEALQTAHQLFHEREHLLTDEAIDKASSALDGRLTALERDLDRWRDSASGFMTVDRFDREHNALVQKLDASLARLEEKLGAEEKVTITQTTRDDVLKTSKESNQRLFWLLVANGLTLAALLLHLAKVY